MGQHAAALHYHQMDLRIGQQAGDKEAQIRAASNIGDTYEMLEEYDKAIGYHEQHLNVATLVNDRVAKIAAFSSLGKHQNIMCHYRKFMFVSEI